MKTLLAIFLVAQPLCWAQQTTNQNIYDARLTYNASPNGYVTTTGTISASSHTLTVASATGWGVGMGVLVTGGCASGCTTQASGTFLWTYVTAISGTTLTLNDAAGASVSGGRVAHDEQRAINAAQAAAYNSGGGAALLSKDPITGNCVYKVSGPLSAATNSLLTLPQNLNVDDPIRLNLVGQITGYSVDNLTITGGCGIDFTDAPAASGTKPALIAGAPYVVITSGNFTTSFEAVEYGIDGLYILGPNQSALNGILLNNVASARIGMNAPVGIATKADSANTWSQPTGGTTALWMPGWLNDVKNSVGEVTISGWNVCHTPGEHEIMSGPYLINCNSAMTFFKAHDLISGTVRIEQVPLMWSVDASVSDEIPINIIADNETNVSVGPAWSRRGTYDLVDTGNHLYGGLSYKIKDETEAYKSINLNGGANLVYCNDGVAPVSGSCGTVITGATAGAPVYASGATGPLLTQTATGAGKPTFATCIAGISYLDTISGNSWDCTLPASGVMMNRSTGATSTGAAAYNTGLLARYAMSDSTGTTMPDTSGNGNNGAFGTGGSPFFGVAPTITATSLHFAGGQTFSNCQLVTANAAAYNTAQTVMVWYKPTAVPSQYAGAVLFSGGSSQTDIYESASNGIPGASTSTDTANIVASSQPWTGIVPAAFEFSGGNATEYYQGAAVTGYFFQTTATAISGSSLLYVGGNTTGGGCFLGDIYYVETYSGALTSAQLITESARVNAILAARGLTLGNQLSVPKPLLVIDGMSITQGYSAAGPTVTGYTDGTDNYTWQANLTLGKTFQIVNLGINGQALTSELAKVSTSVIPIISASTNAIVVVDAPTNDLLGAGTAPGAITNLTSYCMAVHAVAGAKCIVVTMLPRTVAGSSASFSANRATYNSSLRSGWNSTVGADGIIDQAADPTIGPDSAAANATYWNTDGIHPLASADLIASWYWAQEIGRVSSGTSAVPGVLPTVSSCGTGTPTVVGDNFGGTITVGGGLVTSCTLTFGVPFKLTPYFTVADQTTAGIVVKPTPSTTTLVVTSTALSGDSITYVCSARCK